MLSEILRHNSRSPHGMPTFPRVNTPGVGISAVKPAAPRLHPADSKPVGASYQTSSFSREAGGGV